MRDDRSAALASQAQRDFLIWSLAFSGVGAGCFVLVLLLTGNEPLDWGAWGAIGQAGAFVFGLAVAFAGSFVAVKLAAAALRISEESQAMTSRSFELELRGRVSTEVDAVLDDLRRLTAAMRGWWQATDLLTLALPEAMAETWSQPRGAARRRALAAALSVHLDAVREAMRIVSESLLRIEMREGSRQAIERGMREAAESLDAQPLPLLACFDAFHRMARRLAASRAAAGLLGVLPPPTEAERDAYFTELERVLTFGPGRSGVPAPERAVRLTLAQMRLAAAAFGSAEAVDAAYEAGTVAVLEPLPAIAQLVLALPGPDLLSDVLTENLAQRGFEAGRTGLNALVVAELGQVDLRMVMPSVVRIAAERVLRDAPDGPAAVVAATDRTLMERLLDPLGG